METENEQRELALSVLTEAPPRSLFDDPIEYIFADHFRHRTLCNILDDIADDLEADIELIRAVIDFLKRDFGWHVLDEEENLFPLLKQSAASDPGLQDVLRQLQEEHREDHIDATAIVEALKSFLQTSGSRKPSQELRALLRRFAANERQHLMTENAIVLPIARSTLGESELSRLGRSMPRRRGVGTESSH